MPATMARPGSDARSSSIFVSLVHVLQRILDQRLYPFVQDKDLGIIMILALRLERESCQCRRSGLAESGRSEVSAIMLRRRARFFNIIELYGIDSNALARQPCSQV
jgi:hypothetical protein